MPARPLTIDGTAWQVFPSGVITQYDGDEIAILFVRGAGATREVRTTRFSPSGVRGREAALAALSDAELRLLFARSQKSDTSPEAGYAQ